MRRCLRSFHYAPYVPAHNCISRVSAIEHSFKNRTLDYSQSNIQNYILWLRYVTGLSNYMFLKYFTLTKLYEDGFHCAEYRGAEESYAKVAFIVGDTKRRCKNNDKLQKCRHSQITTKCGPHTKRHTLNNTLCEMQRCR